jgi:DNA-binding MarR family transcriptional regulator
MSALGNMDRTELLKQVALAGREHSAAAVTFHAAAAASQDISVTEGKALDLLERTGPLTARQLSEMSGLAPASVTGLIDRLERKGFARRIPHPHDGRRVLVEIHPERAARVRLLFADFLRSLDELYARYTDEQLALIVEFLTECADRENAAAANLAPSPAPTRHRS